jgi:hypothetical protein
VGPVLTLLGMVAEMGLGFIRDRQRAGIDGHICKARPVTFDRVRIVTLCKEGMGAAEVAEVGEPTRASASTLARGWELKHWPPGSMKRYDLVAQECREWSDSCLRREVAIAELHAISGRS